MKISAFSLLNQEAVRSCCKLLQYLMTFDRRGTRPKGSPPSFCEALREAVLALPGVGAEPSEPFEGKAGQHESTCANVNQICNKCVLINRKLLRASALCALHCKRVYVCVCM